MNAIELDIKIKQAVRDWGEEGYQGVSEVTKRLLEFWFYEGHLLENGTEFKFWRCQREAIEHLIYTYEVCRYHSLYELSRGHNVSILFDPTKDRWSKYCFKMATGSGKTFIMAMAIVWQYFNKLYGQNGGIRYSSHYLLLAPNIIVWDRLRKDFENNVIFRDYPFIPLEWQADFDLQTILRSGHEAPHSRGVLHLTNIQQLYERREEEEKNPADEMVGPKPKREETAAYERLISRLTQYDDLMVMNDEAHHLHRDDLEWNRAIEKINEGINEKFSNSLVMQLDFSATPKDLNGRLFTHIIYNYPLAEAIRNTIVKRPRIGEIENIPLPVRKGFVDRHRVQIDTGIEILREFQREFKETDKKPVLFIMTDNTRNADKVGSYLERKGFQNKVLVIHTDTKGVITKKDLDKAREAAREIDSPDNPYEVIVSVMMLKEGWDVKNVCTIVPLRAYDSPILPEQTLGRGLRRMFLDNPYVEERLVVIDHPRFRQLWQAEIDKGELVADFTSAKEAFEPSHRIFVDPEKLQYDFEIPIIEGGLTRTVPDLSKLDVDRLPKRQFIFSAIELTSIMYREKDLLEQKVTREKILSFDYTDNAQIYLSFMTKSILSKIGASALFSDLVPKVKSYIEKHLFDREINLENAEVVKKINYMPIREKILDIFVEEINKLWKTQNIPPSIKYYKISETPLFHTSEPVCNAKKTVFNALPYSKRSQLEKEFMMYLDSQKEVVSFTKILVSFPFRIPYYYKEFLRYYRPDFIVKTEHNFYLIETKGLEEAELSLKMKHAKEWCKKVTELAGMQWEYLKVSREDFESYKTQSFGTLAIGAGNSNCS